MIDGIDYDDRYRMVEDEFLAVAGEFTRHLHAAEYQRLKGLAKSKNAETIDNISRPVTGEMTDLVKRKHAALDTAAKQRKGIRKPLGKRAGRIGSETEDETEGPRRPSTSLQGLMESPRKQTVLLTSAISRPGSAYRDAIEASPSRRRASRPKDRSMAGPSSVHLLDLQDAAPPRAERGHMSATEDDDDLDNQPPWPRENSIRLQEQVEIAPTQHPSNSRSAMETHTKVLAFKGTTRVGTGVSTIPRTNTRQETSTDEHVDVQKNDEDDDLFARLRARRAEQKRRRRDTKPHDGSSTRTSDADAAAINSIPFL